MARAKETTWNRDDRDLLVELRTSQANMEAKISSLEVGVKEINTGITARLLNLESNSVNKLQFDQLSETVGSLVDSRIEFRATMKAWVLVGGAGWSIFMIIVGLYINSHFRI